MSNNRLNRFLNGKGFYVVLGICMIAIGVSAWSAINKTQTPPDEILNSDTAQHFVNEDSSSETENAEDLTTESKEEAEVNKEQEGIEDDRTQNSEEVKNNQTESYSSNQSGLTDNTDISSAAKKQEAEPLAAYFVYPVVGEVIKKFSTSELQYSVTFNDMRLHIGIDIKAPSGSEVKSAGDGKILEVKNDANLGYMVKIDHGNGMVAIYAGLEKKVSVKKNDVVLAGATIGKLGTVNNECLDAPHLHLEFYENEKAVNPLDYLSYVMIQ